MKKGCILLLMVVLLICLAACGPSPAGSNPVASGTAGSLSSQQSGKLGEIRKSGKLILGTSADYAPYEFHKKINGKDHIVGFDINIAREVAKDMGVQLEIRDMEFGNLLTELKMGSVSPLPRSTRKWWARCSMS